jgi:hypothetical protein
MLLGCASERKEMKPKFGLANQKDRNHLEHLGIDESNNEIERKEIETGLEGVAQN